MIGFSQQVTPAPPTHALISPESVMAPGVLKLLCGLQGGRLSRALKAPGKLTGEPGRAESPGQPEGHPPGPTPVGRAEDPRGRCSLVYRGCWARPCARAVLLAWTGGPAGTIASRGGGATLPAPARWLDPRSPPSAAASNAGRRGAGGGCGPHGAGLGAARAGAAPA